MEHLEARLSAVESLSLLGADRAVESGASEDAFVSLVQRVKALDVETSLMEKTTPEFKHCYEAVLKIFPLLKCKKASLKQMSEKVQSLLARQEQMTDAVNSLATIRRLEDVVAKTEFSNAEEYKNTLQSLNEQLLVLIPKVQAQSKEVDELLELYEKATIYISKAVESWELRLQHKKL